MTIVLRFPDFHTAIDAGLSLDDAGIDFHWDNGIGGLPKADEDEYTAVIEDDGVITTRVLPPLLRQYIIEADLEETSPSIPRVKSLRVRIQLWIAVYTHRFGNDVIPYFLPRNSPLTEELAILNLDDWEGDTREDEHIDILGPYEIPIGVSKQSASLTPADFEEMRSTIQELLLALDVALVLAGEQEVNVGVGLTIIGAKERGQKALGLENDNERVFPFERD